MVSNFKRILGELRREANLVAPDHGLKPEAVVELIMNIVDIEDRHRIKTEPRIHQRIKGMIQDVTVAKRARGGASRCC